MGKASNGSGSLFKRAGSSVWIASWSEGGRRRTRSTRTSDKAAARRMLAKCTADAALRDSGLVDASDERARDAGRMPIVDHLNAWRTALLGKGDTRKHADHQYRTLVALFQLAEIDTLAGLSVSSAQTALEAMRQRGLSTRTLNHARGAARSFSRWCSRGGLTRSHTLDALPPIRGTDTTRERRAMTPDECALLIRYTREAGPVFGGVTGADRAMSYTLALGTGLRANEIRKLRRVDCDTAGCIIRIQAATAKNRTATDQPITAELAAQLRDHIANTAGSPTDPALRLPMRAGEAIRGDLRRARVWWAREAINPRESRERWRSGLLRWRDDAGRVADFHSLRVSYITNIVASGANIKAAQTLARHSDANLTLNIYTKLGLNDTRRALDGLPSFDRTGGADNRNASTEAQLRQAFI